MKRMTWWFALFTVMTATGSSQNASNLPKHIAGVYRIYTMEKQIQTDEYQVTPGVKSVDNVKTLDAEGEQKTEIAMSSKVPAESYYQKSLAGIPELRATVEKDYIWFYEREAKVGALTIDPYLMFFDPTAYGGYTLLVRSYNAAKGGSQTFPVIVPALQDYCEIELERHGSDALTSNDKTINASHYRLTLGKRETVNLWVDADRIIAIQMAVKGLFIIDASYPNLLKEVKRIMSKSL